MIKERLNASATSLQRVAVGVPPQTVLGAARSVHSYLKDDEGKPGDFMPTVFSTSSRNIIVPNLIPGRLYLHQGRTLESTTTYSDWSDPSAQRAA